MYFILHVKLNIIYHIIYYIIHNIIYSLRKQYYCFAIKKNLTHTITSYRIRYECRSKENMDFLKGSITELYASAYSAIEKVETSSNFIKLTDFCNNSADQIFTPKYELFHEPENVEASESSNRGKGRRATAKISFHRNDMTKVLTDISQAKTDKSKRELKINWWKEEVMPKIADLWNKQTVLMYPFYLLYLTF